MKYLNILITRKIRIQSGKLYAVLSLLFILFLQGLPLVNAQPAGLFTDSDVALWLIADSNVTAVGGLPATNGQEIDFWTETGLNGFTANRVSNGPIFRADGGADFNNHSVIEFDNTQRYLSVLDDDELDGGHSGLSVFVVFKRGATDNRSLVMKRTGTTTNRSYGIFYNTGTNLYGYFDNGNTVGGSSTIPATGSHTASMVFDGTLAAAQRLQLSLDAGGTASASIGNTTVPNYPSDLLIGLFNPGDTRYLNGDQIAEILILKTGLSNAQRIILENYYNEVYGSAVGTDYYTGNDAAYIIGMSGIGQESDGAFNSGSSDGLFASEISGFDNGEYLMFAHSGISNSVVSSDIPGGVEARWARDWYLEKTGIFNSRIAFDFSDGINGKYPEDIANYTLLYRAGTSGGYSEPTVLSTGVQMGDQVYFELNNVDLLDGYYTLASTDTAASSLIGADGRSWYTLVSGDWEDTLIWTLDPSGTQWVNPDSYTPTTSPTALADKVYILSGRTITVQAGNDNKIHAELLVDGRLDFTTTTGHSFGEINGSGRILLAGDNFPLGDATHFVTAGQGEGTVVYYGSGYSLNTTRTFFDVELELDDPANIDTLLADYTINGDLRINTGELLINDNTSTAGLNITIEGDWIVEADGTVSTGSANAEHYATLKGDFTNYGSSAFTNRLAPAYSSAATDGIVHLVFNNASANQALNCYGIVNLYRVVIDKGIDKTYILSINATNASYFNLFGPANDGHGSVAQLATNDNALALLRGTVKIGTNVSIPVLNNTGNYNISEAAQLWVAGGYVAKTSGTAIVPYGTARVSAGTFESNVGSGFTMRDNGGLLVEGGVLNTYQVRTSVLGASNVGGYVQTGGTVNITNPNSAAADYYHFCLTYPGNTFTMTGGTLHVFDANGGGTSEGGIFIASDPENINVSGGTVIAEIASTTYPFKITSTAPFYNLILRNSNNTTTDHVLDAATNVGTTNENLAAQELVVLNDLTIEDDCFLDHNGQDITVGAGFSISANSQKQGTNNYGLLYNAALPNTLTFNGSTSDTLYIGHDPATSDGYEMRVWNLTINKTSGAEIVLKGDTIKEPANVTQEWHNRLMNVQGTIDVQNGTMNQGKQSIRLYANVYVRSNGILGVYEPGVTILTAYIMLKDDASGGTDLNIEDGAQMGNFKLNPGNGNEVGILGDVYIKRIGYYSGSMNLRTNKLRLDYLHRNATTNNFTYANGTVDRMIFSDGNASDGGLELYIPAGTVDGTQFGFPLGTKTDSTRYTPVRLIISDVSDSGYIQIRPVDGELQTTDLAGGNILSYYWRVSHSGFSNLPTVILRFVYDDYDDDASDEGNFVQGKVLDENPFTRSVPAGNMNPSNNRLNYSATTLENANYTAGVAGRFIGAPEIYYSRTFRNSANSDWRTAAYWTLAPDDIDGNSTVDPYEYHDSRQTAAADYPQAGDIAVIGWVPFGDPNYNDGWPHGMEVRSAVDFAELRFSQMLDANDGDPTERIYAFNFQFRPTICVNPGGSLTGDIISGEGMFWLRSTGTTNQVDPDFSTIDIGDFVAEDSSYLVYETTSSAYIYNNIPAEVPNLMIAGDGWGAQNRDFNITTDVEVMQDFELLGDVNLVLSSGATGDIIVHDDLRIFRNNANGNDSQGDGEIAFPNDAVRTIEIFDDLELVNIRAQVHVRNPNTTVFEHELTIHGNIWQNNTTGGGLQLYSAIDEDYINLTLEGTGDHNYTINTGTTASLYSLTMNKGVDQSSSFTFNNDFSLNGPTSGVGVSKSLDLQNGTLILNSAGINLDLTTGDNDFLIPSTAAIEVRQGQINANGNSGILLDGKLLVSGGIVDMSGGDNYIQYSSTGNATLEITSGALTVGSQIRRGLTSTEGILSYTQSGGAVIVGETSALEGNRGVFEILNTGSSFTHSGGSLSLIHQQTNPTFASLYLDPDTYSLSPGTSIDLGGALTIGGEEFGIYSSIPLRNLRIDNTSTNDPTATMWVLPLVIEENLTIDYATTFDASGLDLNIRGDFLNGGSFIPNGNTTTFDGTSDQMISGNTDFYNLVKSTTNLLGLTPGSTNLNILNVLDLQAGEFADSNNTVLVAGNCNNDALHLYGGTGNGIELNGVIQQDLTGNGIFGKLAINNINGVFVPLGNSITIANVLRLESGILNIGKNLLDLELTALIEAGAPFSALNMIQTNISFTDNGVRKAMPAGASNFLFPMGSAGKYTPVNFAITGNGNSTGFITVKPANERHPSILEDTEAPPIVDIDNVLQYHWILRADGISGFSGAVRMKYYPADVKVTTPPYTVLDYITARLLADGSGNWNKYPDVDKFDEINEELIFDFAGVNSDGISGDYTAGIIDAIPDVVPLYQTETSGDWINGVLWDPDVAGGPRGAIARINAGHIIDVPGNFISSYETQIIGRVNVDSTFGHRFGIVNGTGVLYTEREALPAGDYDVFFSNAGGTVEFGGSGDYDLLGGYIFVNNLTISGAGERRLPNSDLLVYGDLIINASGNLDLVNEYNRNLNIKGDLIRTSGNFDAGNSSSIVEFSGITPQLISGGFKASNGFNNLNINNSTGVTVTGSISVDNQLQLNGGVLSSGSDTVFISYSADISPAAGSSSSFVNGNLSKELFTGDSFTFPIGDGAGQGNMSLLNLSGFGGVQNFNSRYNYSTPPSATSFSSPISQVSLTEYWEIAAPNASQGQIRIDLDGSSDVANGSDLDSLRLVTWDGSEWVIVGGTPANTGTASSGTITTNAGSPVLFDGTTQLFALASIQTVVTATISYSTGDQVICAGDSVTLTVVFNGENPWDFSFSDGTTTFNKTGLSTPTFDTIVVPASTLTYTLLSVSDNNGAGTLVGNIDVAVTVNALPIPSLTGNITACESEASLIYSTEIGMTNYNWNTSAGGLITAGGTIASSAATITWNGSGAQSISVNYTNAVGCTAASPTVLNVNVTPAPTPSITGTDTACIGVTLVYTTEGGADAGTYVWTIPPAYGTISAGGGANDNTVDVDWINYVPVGSPTTIRVSYEALGCPPINITEMDIMIFKNPDTGPAHHIDDTLFP